MVRIKKTKSKKSKKSNLDYSKLRKYNFVAAALLLIQGVLILVLSNSDHATRAITTNFVTQDKVASDVAGHTVLAPAAHHLIDVNLAYVAAAFLFISFLAHLIVATRQRKAYEADLKKGINRYRWIAYAFSISIMMGAIALVVGILDLTSLLMVLIFTALMSLLGLAMETRNQGSSKKVDWTNYNLGVGAALVPWFVFLVYIWNSHAYGSGLPAFVYWLYGSLLILFSTFAINMYLSYKKMGHWETYLHGERAYIVMTLITETVLAWQIFFGTLR